MKGFIKEFKAFAVKGNVVDLAVAVVIGAAFGKIVSSLVNNIVTPILGLLMGGINFSGLVYKIGDTEITYGIFLQSIIDFVIVSLAIFVAIRALNRVKGVFEGDEEIVVNDEKTAEPSDEVKLLREIRDSLQR